MENSMRPDVSIVAPVYKVEKYISASVKSMLAQTHKNIEIILVDDGSPDNCGKICDEFAAADPRVRVIHKKNEGTGEARNTGMDAARGEYIYFADPDDIIDPKLVEDNYNLAKKFDADIVEFGYRYIKVTENNMLHSDYTEPNMPNLDGVYTRDEFWANFEEEYKQIEALWLRLFRLDFLREQGVRSRPYRRMQDSALLYDIYGLPFNKIVYNPKRYYTYVKRPGSAVKLFKQEMLEDTFASLGHYARALRAGIKDSEKCEKFIAEKYCDNATWHISDMVLQCNLPEKEMLSVIKNHFDRPEFQNAFAIMKKDNDYGFSRRVAIWLMSNHHYKAYLLMRKLVKKK